MRQALIVDCSIYLHRAWHQSDGAPLGMVNGFAETMLQALHDLQPTFVACCFDSGLPSFRADQWPAYKAHRPPHPPGFDDQVETCKQVAEALGCAVLCQDRVEADDLIAGAVQLLSWHGVDCLIMSVDKDLAQLVCNEASDDDTGFLTITRRVRMLTEPGGELRGVKQIREKYGVWPHQIAEWIGLAGDVADGLPGVEGIGEKTAAFLVREHRTIERIKAADGVQAMFKTRPAKKALNFARDYEQALLSRDLAKLRPDDMQGVDFEGLRYLWPQAEIAYALPLPAWHAVFDAGVEVDVLGALLTAQRGALAGDLASLLTDLQDQPMDALDSLLNESADGDALQGLLDDPPAAAAAPPPDKAAKQRIWAIDPEVQLPDGTDLDAALKTAAAQQTALIVEIMTLDPATYPEASQSGLREMNLIQLRKVRAQCGPLDPASMERHQLTGEISGFGIPVETAAKYSDDELRRIVGKLRSTAATANHGINSPEQVDPTTNPTLPEQAKAAAPAPAPKASTRGVKMPLPDGTLKLISKTTKAELRTFIEGKGIHYPAGKGATGRARSIAKTLLTGSTDVGRYGPFEGNIGSPATPPEDKAATTGTLVEGEAEKLAICRAEIVEIAGRLGITLPTNPSGWNKAKIVQELQKLRLLSDEMAEVAAVPDPPPIDPDALGARESLTIAIMQAARVAGLNYALTPTDWPIAKLQQELARLQALPPAPSKVAYVEPGEAPPPLQATPDPGWQKVEQAGGLQDGFDLYVNCRPDAGIGRALPTACQLYGDAVAKACSVAHYMAIPFHQGPAKVAAMVDQAIRAGTLKLSDPVYVSTRTDLGPFLVDVLTPLARRVIRGDA